MSDLLPCPFCGGEASRSLGKRADGSPWPYVECESCEAMAEPDLWNRRAPAVQPQGVKVKPLVWENFDAWTYWAKTQLGTYHVEDRRGVWRTTLAQKNGEGEVVYEYTTDGSPNDGQAAKAAAQADYDARILATIEPATVTLAAALALPEVKALEEALTALLLRDEINTCRHENTHRGGFLWEICDDCGMRWADDEGGKPVWSDPPEWSMALAALRRIAEARHD